MTDKQLAILLQHVSERLVTIRESGGQRYKVMQSLGELIEMLDEQVRCLLTEHPYDVTFK